jgi:hypothetical protein
LVPGVDPEAVSSKDIRAVLTVHHSELVCARMVTSRDLMMASSAATSDDGVAGQEGEKFYVELILKMSSRCQLQLQLQGRRCIVSYLISGEL